MRIRRRIGVPALVLSMAMMLVLLFQISGLAASSSEYDVPTSSSHPYAITSGPGGYLWFTESAGNKIARMSSAGTITEFNIPTAGGNPHGITSTSDAVWFVEWATGKIGRLTLAGTFSEFNIPTTNSGPWSIALGSDNALWFTESATNKIGRCDQSGVVTEFPVPTANSVPFNIVAAPDGALWFTEFGANKIGRCSTSGAITEFNVPTANAGPYWITVGLDGALWFTEWTANKIGRCTTAGVFSESNVPTAGSMPSGIAAAQDGTVWFVEAFGNKIGRCSSTGAVTNEYPIATDSSGSSGATVGPDGRLWFCEWGASKIGAMSMSTPVWYLAEGSSAWGFNTYVTIMNPNNAWETAAITYMTPQGQTKRPDLKLPPLSQSVIDPRTDLNSNTDFSTKVECTSGDSIAVDRTMFWTGPGAPALEAHSSIGVTSPARNWDLAEGCSAFGFETWLLIQNPNPVNATCKVTYMTEEWGAQSFDKVVPANSRMSFSMAADIGAKNSSIKVDADVPVIPERSMYRNNRREGTDSIGTASPSAGNVAFPRGPVANTSFLAEGSTQYGFTTYVLVQNPNSSQATVTLTYMTTNGPAHEEPFVMPPNSRVTINVNNILPNTDFSTLVTADVPIVGERAMYWNNGTGEASHDTIGLSNPHTSFYFPDGQTSAGWETYTLVGNPNDQPVNVVVTYLPQGGAATETVSRVLAPRSRFTFSMAEKVPSGRSAIMVTCTTTGNQVTAERAMYKDNRSAGTCTIGGYSD